MTSILRVGDYVASDECFFTDVTVHMAIKVPRGAKFYALPEQTAIVAITGEFKSEAIFEKVLQEVRNTLLRHYMGEENPTQTLEGISEIGGILILTRDASLIGRIEMREELNWTSYPVDRAVVMGSGEDFVDLNLVATPFKEGEEMERIHALMYSIWRMDPVSGGDIYAFNLTGLKPFEVPAC